MSIPSSLGQGLLAAAMVLAVLLTFVGVSPPHDTTKSAPSTGDLIRTVNLTNQTSNMLVYSHVAALALYTAYLTVLYRGIPSAAMGYGLENGLNTKLLTWTPETAIPLGFIILVGAPLRLIPYASLGENFTFALAEPRRLIRAGIYRYMQHPSYTGLAILFAGNAALYYRYDGAVSCWVPPAWYPTAQTLVLALWPIFVVGVVVGISVRVRQEELMLRGKFGREWEEWHAKTARFIPGVW